MAARHGGGGAGGCSAPGRPTGPPRWAPAAGGFDARLPELLAGFGADEVAPPVSYPASCRPQAWAAAAAAGC